MVFLPLFAAAESQPKFPCILRKDNKEQEDEESLEGVEDYEEKLEHF